MQLDDESVEIKSFYLNNLDTVFINHTSDGYVGRVATVSSGNTANNLLWSLNGTTIITDDEIHFIYGSETYTSTVGVSLFETYPYNYSLEDINPNSDETYGETLSPGYFENQVTLHYFGHQT